MATRRPAVPRTPGTKRRPPAPAAGGPAAKDGPRASAHAAPKTPRASSSRATAPSPGRAATPAAEVPVPARAFSGRILALAVVLVAITVMLAPTVRVFLSQRAEISSLEQDIAARKTEQDGLRQSISRWEDPSYVKQQARDRINMVMPGETSYWVFGDVGSTSPAAGSPASQSGGDRPWAEGFWDSFVRAATE
ncbi:FtsB family cell division protein [Sinomonas flava]|uniref:FtsB family cell division protein n=1 Tax=Sinomonas flava TaxID=496857 RepID=UPI0039A5FC26